MSIPLLPGYRREVVPRGTYPKSHHFDVVVGAGGTAQPLTVKRDTLIDPRSKIPPSSFNGTGTLQPQLDTSIIRGAAAITHTSAASNHSATGRLPEGTPPIEEHFGSPAWKESKDKYAHLRRAPVAKDFANTAEPLPFLPVLEERLPSWVEFDRKVLRFSGYFKEAVHSSSNETWRCRPILLYYYLEDDSMHIAEPPVHNSGLPQGVFVKRHRVPKDELGEIFQPEDLYIGALLPIYGRAFRLVNADQFTREFYEKNGAPLTEAEEIPVDSFKSNSIDPITLTFKKKANALTAHHEAAMGMQHHGGIARTQQFLKNDNKVCRFYATSEDNKLYGEKRPYIIHVFLADDTVEVLEVPLPNSGYGSFTNLLKRSKLPIDHTIIKRDVAHIGGSNAQVLAEDPRMQYYSDKHFKIGGTINVYGRELLIRGCDAWTKKYYMTTYGLPESDFEQIGMKDPVEEPVKIPVPPYTGFGTEEDSLGSFLYLVPKQPKTDQVKLHEMDGVLLRFSAALSKPTYVDRERKFIITYYLANDTMQIFETFERNAGHIGGKFLDRSRAMNVRTKEYFLPRDIYVGGKIEVNCTEFIILDADEYTRKFQANNPKIWNAEAGNLNDDAAALAWTGGKKFDVRVSAASNTLPNRRPF